ncbi:GNAT family N-acetyltransferase [Arthrobacter luteolus]|uniref:GNAT family N-acetyltransferase n=1 Tax=Arthrobacter luteolus TaxID=98672 RepID=UPI00384FA022
MPLRRPTTSLQPLPLSLESAMDAAWPALDRHKSGGWILRAAGGVTQRANSVWPRGINGHSGEELSGLLREARSWYGRRRLPVIFQISEDADDAAALHNLLDVEGFTRPSSTRVLTRSAKDLPDPALFPGAPAVELSSVPSDDWMHVWWLVDGRGGNEEQAIALRILSGCPSVYALVRNNDGRPAAVGRLALPEGSSMGGIYCMSTLPEARRQGFAAAVLEELLRAGNDSDVTDFWLQVTAANLDAQGLYARAGFRLSGSYVYRQDSRHSAPSGR